MPNFWAQTNKLDLAFLLFAALFLYLHLFQLPFTPFFFENDQFIVLHEAVRMYEGEIMYRDFFDIIFPGAPFLYMVLFKIFGIHYWILNAVIFSIGIISTWLCLRISQKVIGGSLAYLPPMLYLFFGLRWLGLDGSYRMLSPIAIAAAILLLLDKRTIPRLVGAGCCCALASFFTQQRGFVGICAIAIFVLCEAYSQKESWRQTAFSLLVLSVSFVVALFALCGYFVLAAGFDNFYYATFVHTRLYYREEPFNNYSTFLFELKESLSEHKWTSAAVYSFYYLTPLAYAAFFIYLFFRWRKYDWDYWRKPLLIALLGGFVALTTAIAPTVPRLFQVSIPALVLLVWLVTQLNFGKFLKSLAYACLVILPVFAVALSVRSQTYPELTYFDAPVGRLAVFTPESIARFQWLRERTKPGDYVFEVYQPSVYFPLALRNPSRILITRDNGFSRPNQVSDIIRDLQAKPAKYILWDNKWNKPPADRAPNDNLAPLYEYLLNEYQPVSPIYFYGHRDIQIYERKVAASPTVREGAAYATPSLTVGLPLRISN